MTIDTTPRSGTEPGGGPLGSPLALGSVVLRNRIVAAPMERAYCTSEGYVTDYYRAYLRRFADEGVALVTAEATFVRADGRGRANQLGLHTDACIPGIAALADDLHARGALLALELKHGGRTAQRAVTGLPNVAPSPVACDVTGGGVPRALTHGDILEILQAFGDAAKRAERAGVDVLTIHGAHGYLIHQFMSKRHNLRTDAWRRPGAFLDAVIETVRAAVPGMTVGLRISSVDGSEGGNTPEEQYEIIAGARLDLLDFLDVSAGSYESGQWTIQSGEWRPGFLAPYARRYRALGLPLGLAGRLNSPETAAAVVADGTADFVSIGRALHADPSWASAALRGGAYTPCIACNVCIDGLGAGPVVCTVNPDVGRPTLLDPPLPAVRGDAVVVGGGPAGVTAALVLANAGIRVSLVEQRARLGGRMASAATQASDREFRRWLRWAADALAQAEVDVRLETSWDGDAAGRLVIDARGGRPARAVIPGIDLERVHDLDAWLGAGAPPPASAVVWGEDGAAMAVADDLAQRGSRVLVVCATPDFAAELGRRSRMLTGPRLRSNPSVEVMLRTVIDEIGPDWLDLSTPDGPRRIDWAGPVLASLGRSTPPSIDADLVVGDAAGYPVSTIRNAITHATDGARALVRSIAG